jgi:hypothetical protein
VSQRSRLWEWASDDLRGRSHHAGAGVAVFWVAFRRHPTRPLTMSDLRDRAAAIGLETHELRREAALTNDVQSLVPLKECDRALKREFGRGEDLPDDTYSAFKERMVEQLYQTDKAEEGVIQKRIANLTANVRAEVEAEHAAERAELEATASALEYRDLDVAAREKKAPPSYRGRFAAAGAGLVLVADVLFRAVG